MFFIIEARVYLKEQKFIILGHIPSLSILPSQRALSGVKRKSHYWNASNLSTNDIVSNKILNAGKALMVLK